MTQGLPYNTQSETLSESKEANATKKLRKGLRKASPKRRSHRHDRCEKEHRTSSHSNRQRNPYDSPDSHEQRRNSDQHIHLPWFNVLQHGISTVIPLMSAMSSLDWKTHINLKVPRNYPQKYPCGLHNRQRNDIKENDRNKRQNSLPFTPSQWIRWTGRRRR